MTSIASAKNRQHSSTRSSGVLVLEPPRHTHLPLAFLGPGKHLIGTSDGCTIRIKAEGVEPRHAMILVGDQKILLKALDSRTWVNDGVVSETALRSGDRISIGPMTYRVRFATTEEMRHYVPSGIEHGNSNSKVIDPQQAGPDFHDPDSLAESLIVEAKTRVEAVSLAEPNSTPREVPLATRSISGVPAGAQFVSVSSQLVDKTAEPTVSPQCETRHAATVSSVEEYEQLAVSMAPEAQLQEICRQIEGLNDQAAGFGDGRELSGVLAQKQRFAAREIELKHLADELARQSQRQRERETHIVEREAELERQQGQLAVENERLVTAAQATRRELANEHSRQTALWQEWDAAYRRTADDLKSQLEAVEQRRACIQIENERLVSDRAEVQRLQAEYDRERRAAGAERVQAASELGELHTQRAAFETERRQNLIALQEREAQVASERRALAVAQDELLVTRQQIEHDRTLFATERSSDSHRREQEVREHTVARIRLNDEESALQAVRIELEATRRSLEEQRTELLREKEQFELARAEVDNLRVQLSQAEIELNLHRQAQQEQQTPKELSDNETRRQREELEEWQMSLHAQHVQLEAIRASIQLEQKAIDAGRIELTAIAESLWKDRADSHPIHQTKDPSTTTANDAFLGVSGVEPLEEHAPIGGDQFSSVSQRLGADYSSTPLPPSVPTDIPTTEPGHFGIQDLPNAGSFDNLFSGVDHRSPGGSISPTMNWNLSPDPSLATSTLISTRRHVLDVESEISTDSELLVAPSEAIALMKIPSVDATLSDINQQFGFLSSPSEQAQLSAEPDGQVAEAEASPIEATFIESQRDSFSVTDESPIVSSSTTPVDKLSPAGLRAQLVQMFELPEDVKFEESVSEDSSFAQGQQQQTSMESREELLIEQSSSEAGVSSLVSADASSSGTSDSADEFSLASDDSSAAFEDSSTSTDDEPTEDETAWTRRLRELSQFSAPEPEVPIVSSSGSAIEESRSVEQEPEAPNAAEDDDEFSVEAQLARLLGRPRRGTGDRSAAPLPAETSDQRSQIVSEDLSDPEMPVANDDSDRSHLKAEPRHKQNKNAVRDEVQSFRAVAQMSARTALAKHSWKNLRSKFYFTAGLTVVSGGAAAWYLGNYIYGYDTEMWKGITCAVSAIYCAQKLIRSSSQLNQCRRTNSSRNVADNRSTNTNEGTSTP